MIPVARVNAVLRAMGRAALEREDELAAIYAKALRAAARATADAFVTALTVAEPPGTGLHIGVTAAGEWVPPELPEQDDDLLEAARLKREQAAAEVEEALRTRLGGLAISFDAATFRVFSPELLDPLAQHAAANFSAEMRDRTAKAIQESFDAGLSVPDTARAIRVAVEEASEATATMLARTDLIGLANGGSYRAATAIYEDETETVFKTWHNAHDARVRPTHSAAGGQTVPLAATFNVGGSRLQYPGDPGGPPQEVINCRCTFTVAEVLTAAAAKQEAEMSETATETPATAVRWRSVLVLEDVQTDDGRLIDAGALDWRDLPLTLMAMTETSAGGHEGAGVAGRIDAIRRSAPEVIGEGIFDGGELGMDIARLVGDKTLRGVSVDLAIREYELRNEDGSVLDEEDFFDPEATVVFAITDASIMGATVCPFPAFADANIELLASGEGWPVVVELAEDHRTARVTTVFAAALVEDAEELALEDGEQGVADGSLGETLRRLYADSSTIAATARSYSLDSGEQLFAAIYRDANEGADRIGEQTLVVGSRPPTGLSEVIDLRTFQDGAPTPSRTLMASALFAQNEEMLAGLTAAFSEASAAEQFGVADVLSSRIERHQRWSVQLRGLLAAG